MTSSTAANPPMASSLGNNIETCSVCSGIISAGEAMFTAECSHSFHSPCVGNFIASGNRLCPLCNSFWNHLPFTFCNNDLPVFEPLQFNDDEPLPAHPASSPSDIVGLQNLTIKAVPERPAVAASEPMSLFSVLVGLKAPSMASDDAAISNQRASIDIVTVLDVSGSMDGRKLDLVKRAVGFVIDNLGVSDRLSIVSFSDRATRLLSLRRMTENGKEDAKRAANLLRAGGCTNIVDGLKKGAQVLGERRYKNPVSTIIFLSDGNDTCHNGFRNSRNALPGYLHLLPDSIYPKNQGVEQEVGELETIPVHSFGFGSDHDPITMHAISDASGGTFSFIESYVMVQDAFAGCIGGLLSVVAQEVRLKVRSASHGVEIKSIPSGRYTSQMMNQGSEGLINIGDLYADEEKQFLINLSIPALPDNEESEEKTSLLDIMCSYKNSVSKEMVEIEGELVEIQRPKSPSLEEMMTNMEIDRQRNRLLAAEAIKEAQELAETGDLRSARSVLEKKRNDLLATASAQAGDGMCKWLANEMEETEMLMGSSQVYRQAGRAYALSGMISHGYQRATTRGNVVPGAGPGRVPIAPPPPRAGPGGVPMAPPLPGAGPGLELCGSSLGDSGFDSSDEDMGFGLDDNMALGNDDDSGGAALGCPYTTPNMVSMVKKSQQLNKTEEDAIAKKD